MNVWLTNTESDELGEAYIRDYYDKFPSNSLCVDIEGFAKDYLKLDIVYESIVEDDKDKIGFLADGVEPLKISRNGKKESVVFKKNTIVIDEFLLNESESVRKRFTIAHEVAHYLLRMKFPANNVAQYHREFDSEKKYSGPELGNLLSFSENRADRLAAALLMPHFNMKKALDKYAGGEHFTIYGSSLMSTEDRFRLKVMADGVGVSCTAMEIRLNEMGLVDKKTMADYIAQDYQDGDFSDEDIPYDRRYGELTPEQAYLIHRSRREAERMEKREVKCPACGFRMTEAGSDSRGHTTLKCQKCKFQEPLNLAYFRTMKNAKGSPDAEIPKPKRKRQSR